MGRAPRCLYRRYRRSLCLFQHRTAEVVPKEWFLKIFLLRFFLPHVRGSGSISVPPPPAPPTPTKMSGLGFVLSWTLLVRIFRTAPCAYFWPWLLPVGWGRSPRRVDSWQKMWWALEHVFEGRWVVRLWEFSGALSQGIVTIYIFRGEKKRPNFSKWWFFFLQPQFAQFLDSGLALPLWWSHTIWPYFLIGRGGFLIESWAALTGLGIGVGRLACEFWLR